MTELASGTELELAGQTLAGQKKHSKIRRIPWIGRLTEALSEGLAESQWLADVQKDQMAAGRKISLELWPFIVRLPDNIKAVREKLPPALEPAKLFLSSLADDEKGYQELYIKQCHLAGLSIQDLLASESRPTAATAALVAAMQEACVEMDVASGAQAIVAAELAAAQFARSVMDAFDIYFQHHQGQYAPDRVEEGLAWVRLHAKTNTRQALWMNRMLCGLGEGKHAGPDAGADNVTETGIGSSTNRRAGIGTGPDAGADNVTETDIGSSTNRHTGIGTGPDACAGIDAGTDAQPRALPPPVRSVLGPIFDLWQVKESTRLRWLPQPKIKVNQGSG